MDYKLFYYPGSAAMAPHAIIRDTDATLELLAVDTAKMRSETYKALNPNSTVPVLIFDDGKTMYESAAICQFLVERHPELGLNPAQGSAARAQYLQWMTHLTNTVQEAMTIWWHPAQYTEDLQVQQQLRRESETRLARLWAVIDAHLAADGPYLCGGNFYTCDYYLAMLVRWTRDMQKPGHTYPNINAVVRAAIARRGYGEMLAEQCIEQII